MPPTVEHLLSEGRRLARPSVLLGPHPRGPVAAVWHDWDIPLEDITDPRKWLTVESRFIPGPPLPGPFLPLVTTGYDGSGSDGVVETLDQLPPVQPPGSTALYARSADLLPPIEVLFQYGDETIGAWLESHQWDRSYRYDSNFPDQHLVSQYEKVMMDTHPFWKDPDDAQGAWAILGGWHIPGADDDWHDLLDHRLLILTLKDSEPWVEAWERPDGEFRVIPRIT